MQWVNLLGMSVTDLKIPRNRCIFNIKSALWAGDHFAEKVNFKSKGTVQVDPDSPITKLPTTRHFQTNSTAVKQEGDMIACDTCSLSEGCKHYREGAVCTVQGSETNPLAKLFNSRDSSRIIDGLGTILAAQTERLERGMNLEEEDEVLDPEVTKIMNQLFTNGVKLAKLIDPSLSKPLVQINNGKAVAGASPKEFVAIAVRALEDQGIKREDITPELLEATLRRLAGPVIPDQPRAIEGEVVNG
jgi:hypothetical protein